MKKLPFLISLNINSIKQRKSLFATIVFSLAIMFVMPIILIGIAYNAHEYLYSYVPKQLEKTYSIFPNSPLDSYQLKRNLSQISIIAESKADRLTLEIEDETLFYIDVVGYSVESLNIFQLNVVQGEPINEQFFNSTNTCYIGTSIANQIGTNTTYITINGKSYKIKGWIHNQEYIDKVVVSNINDQLFHHQPISYLIELKNKSDEIAVKDYLIKHYGITENQFKSWGLYFKDSINQFQQVAIVCGIVICLLLIYGLINIIILLIGKNELEETTTTIQMYCGASKKDLFITEFLYLFSSSTLAIILDISLIILLGKQTMNISGIYFILNYSVVIVSILVCLITSILVAFVLFKQRLKKQSIYVR